MLLRLEGDHSESEERQALAEAIVNPRCAVPLPLLIDVRDSTANPDIASIAGRARCLGNLKACMSDRCAVVVTRPSQFGLARMLATYAEFQGLDIGVFWDENEARHWLANTNSQVDRSHV